ncbi:MAG: hypothetical protein Q9163_004570 [Psora crenata]
MPDKYDFSDDHVAQLLAKDAEGINSRATHNPPKPNTRFLENIIKETAHHNAALRAKEAQESRVMLRRPPSIRGRSYGDSEDYGRLKDMNGSHGSKRRRIGHHDEDYAYKRSTEHRHSRKEGHQVRERREGDRDRTKSKGNHSEGVEEGYQARERRDGDRDRTKPKGKDNEEVEIEGAYPRRHRHHRRHLRRRSLSESAAERGGRSSRSRARSRQSGRKHRHQHHDLSRRRREADSDADSHSETRMKRSGSAMADSRASAHHTPEDPKASSPARSSLSPASDSDPLDSVIGPPPPLPQAPVQFRGRGAVSVSSVSAIDAHFASNYDPALDAAAVGLDLEADDDWDEALEALRDRLKWEQQGAARLRAAGFSEEEVAQWGGGQKRGPGMEKGEEDVRWKGRGEGREWDRGKVVTQDGVETEIEWGRLKGS